MKKIALLYLFLGPYLGGCAQSSSKNKEAGFQKGTRVESCESCDALYESPVPHIRLKATDTLPDFSDPGPKMEVTGTVYQPDGKTPAKDVIVYIYHTDQNGIYPKKEGQKGWARQHGYIRGWVKTDEEGHYRFLTLRPGAYPGGQNPQHIHVLIREPGGKEYYIDDFHFADDPILQKSSAAFSSRGGSGIIKVDYGKDRQVARRDIILGLNIPGY